MGEDWIAIATLVGVALILVCVLTLVIMHSVDWHYRARIEPIEGTELLYEHRCEHKLCRPLEDEPESMLNQVLSARPMEDA